MKNLKNISLTLFFTAIIVLGFAVPVNPPGWYQQPLPVNDQINDIYFINAETGWIVTNGRFNTNDTAYIMKTTDGGTSWVIQKSRLEELNAVQFLDANTGFAGGGVNGTVMASIYKTTNGGTNWTDLNNLGGTRVNDMAFVSKDTGWISFEGGLTSFILKTENGGLNWSQQYTQSEHLGKIFMLNKDTGWFTTQSANGQLYRTTNGGMNWGLLYTFPNTILSFCFTNFTNGYIGGISPTIQYTTNGGLNWAVSNGEIGGYSISFINDSIGFAGGGSVPLRILKTTDYGRIWYYQNAPATPNISIAVLKNDTSNVWAGRQILIHTTDGGGQLYLGVEQISTEIPEEYKLYQNYPNPFNPITRIKYSLKQRTSNVKLIIYDLTGRQKYNFVYTDQNAGTYETELDATGMASGVYFYLLSVNDKVIDTKKLMLIK